MVQQTSIDAYNDNAEHFATLGDRILAYMGSHRETRTRAEIADKLRIPTATMSGRIRELLNKGTLIEEPGRFTCRVTKNSVRGVSIAA